MRTTAPIRAAGGVVWRFDAGDQESGDQLQVAVVHRNRYDDWSLPKGKLKAGERSLLAAVREIGEEIGSTVAVGRRLLSTEYRTNDGVKLVSYWAMRHLGGRHEPSEEVDEVRWLTPDQASDLVSYEGDRLVVADFMARPLATSTVLLVRHAKAGKRSEYLGDDSLRPLDKIGRRQARDSVSFLAAFGPRRILTADRVRCRQTITPLAEHLGLPLEERPEFSDESYAEYPGRAQRALLDLLEPHVTTALCSQGGAIPALLDALDVPRSDLPARKGSLWVLSFAGRDLIAADYYPHPQV